MIRHPNPTLSAILRELEQRDLADEFTTIAKRHGVLLRELFDRWANHPPAAISFARHECWSLLRGRSWSYPRIGALFGVDHSSVMHGVRAHEKRLAKAIVDELRRGAA